MYKTLIPVTVPTTLVSKAYTYACAVVDTINYSDSNQTNKEKIKFDHFYGKIGEEAARYVLLQTNIGPVSSPDYEIYTGKGKSWDKDLHVEAADIREDIPIGIKSQTSKSAKWTKLSFILQNSSRRKDSTLNNDNDLIIPVFIISETNGKDIVRNVFSSGDFKTIFSEVTCYVFPPLLIKNIIFGEMVKKEIVGKNVFYAKDNYPEVYQWFSQYNLDINYL